MIRFKVIKASRILFVITAIVLAAVLILMLFTSKGLSANTYPSASLVNDNTAKAQRVFAVLDEENISMEILTDKDNSDAGSSQPRVIIYHTHTHEAYEQNNRETYEAIEAWRTTDKDYSVVRVGKELAEALREYGFYVVHDTTDHEQDDLSTAYDRSVKTLESYETDFDLYIDLHRDAYSEGLPLKYTSPDGSTSAQLMMLIGNGNGFETKPYYFENHVFAKKLTQRINEMHPGICRDVLVKDGRYNQHIGIFSILVEIGHNRNSLSEALNAIQPLAEGIYDIFIRQPDIMIQGIMEDYRS